mgnify:CR=1 FL=1
MNDNSMLLFDKEALHHSSKEKKKNRILESSDLPNHPRTFDWKLLEDPERIGKKFEFDDFKTLFSFMLNLLKHQEKSEHHADIYVQHRSVSVEVFTHDVNSVTELDLEFARFCDDLFVDVRYHFMGGED